MFFTRCFVTPRRDVRAVLSNPFGTVVARLHNRAINIFVNRATPVRVLSFFFVFITWLFVAQFFVYLLFSFEIQLSVDLIRFARVSSMPLLASACVASLLLCLKGLKVTRKL